jgi:hypothetical protein
MNYNIPVRQIFLQDAISTEKTCVSTLAQKRGLANTLYFFKYLCYASISSSLAFAYLTVNKKYTNRKVYFFSFLGSMAITALATIKYNSLKIKCLEEFKCSKEQFDDFAWFYNYSIIDLTRK